MDYIEIITDCCIVFYVGISCQYCKLCGLFINTKSV